MSEEQELTAALKSLISCIPVTRSKTNCLYGISRLCHLLSEQCADLETSPLCGGYKKPQPDGERDGNEVLSYWLHLNSESNTIPVLEEKTGVWCFGNDKNVVFRIPCISGNYRGSIPIDWFSFHSTDDSKGFAHTFDKDNLKENLLHFSSDDSEDSQVFFIIQMGVCTV